MKILLLKLLKILVLKTNKHRKVKLLRLSICMWLKLSEDYYLHMMNILFFYAISEKYYMSLTVIEELEWQTCIS